jgi:hypothetical protein
MKNITTFLILLIVISVHAQSQDSDSLEERIQNLLFSQNNINYLVYSYNINDAALDKDIEIVDVNHLLTNCHIFIATDTSFSRKILFGVYKNNAIIWNSGPIVNAVQINDFSLWKILDLQNNGDIDIIVSIFPNCGSIYCESLWVIKWDGTNGQIINQNDDGESKIFTEAGAFELVDVDGDGILEILGQRIDSSGYEENTQEEVVNTSPVLFSWQGNQIGDYGVNIPSLLPRNKLNVAIKAKSIKKDSRYNYSYQVTNLQISKQNIENFSIHANIDSVYSSNSPANWWFINRNDSSLLYFGWDPDSSDFNFIMPGEEDSNFTYSVKNLPSVVKYFVQGNNGEPNYYVSEIPENSVIGYTVGPLSRTDLSNEEDIDSLLNYTQESFRFSWIFDSSTTNEYLNFFETAKAQLQQNNISGVTSTLNQVLQDVNQDSVSNLTSEAYALIRYNTEYLLAHLPNSNPPSLGIKLENSSGNLLTGGTLQYYDGSWKDATNNGDGTFGINTTKSTLSLRMTYAYGSQTVSNVPAQNNAYIFQTKNVSVQLKNSQGNLIDTGTVQYYAGAWRDLGTTTNGVATKELLPNTYSFRMTYAHASNDKQQDIGANPTVVFQTVNANVQLQNSQGNPIDVGTVQYYAGAWRNLGTTANGSVTKELLPNNYSFRMTYAYASNDKQQNIGTNPIVVFQTVNANVQLQNSQGNLIDTGTVQYYAGAWRDFGTTANGVAAKELLPNSYSFRMTYEYISNDLSQNIGTNNIVKFSTVLCTISVRNSQNQPVNGADIKYYAGAWREIGQTVNGQITKELLPKNISFRMNYNSAQQDKSQDISTNNLVEFNTGTP